MKILINNINNSRKLKQYSNLNKYINEMIIIVVNNRLAEIVDINENNEDK